MGEVADAEKGVLLGDATALLFPIDWPEPFGLVQIEAMATGTPVTAFHRGAAPEIAEDGVTGVVVDGIEEAVAALPAAQKLNCAAIRRRFDARFRVERMARNNLALYGEVLGRDALERGPRAAAETGDS